MITKDRWGICDHLQTLLRREHFQTCIVDIDAPLSQESLSGAVCLEDFNVMDEADALSSNESIFNFVQALSPHFSQQEGFFFNVMHNDDPRLHALSGGAWGLCKTAFQEWSKAFTKCMSLNKRDRSAQDIAELIFDEMFFGSAELEVIYNEEDQRQTLLSVPRPANSLRPLKLLKTDVLLVTGGGRGITANCLVELAKTSPCRLVLLGRSKVLTVPDLPRPSSVEQIRKHLLQDAQRQGLQLNPRELQSKVNEILNSQEIQKTKAELENLGCEVFYAGVDCGQRRELHATLTHIRQQWGPIAGIIHGAGVLHDRLLGELTQAQYRSVFETKVSGALNLLSETTEDPLKLICFFSSVAARWGNRGQSVYAMANEVLNKLACAEAQHRPLCTVKAIAWGPWQGGMVNDSLQKVFAQRKIGMIPLEEGAKSFVNELNDSGSTEIVLAQKPFLSFVPARSPELLVDSTSALKEFTLEDHTIKGSPVIPFAVILEWTLRIVKSIRRDLHLTSLTDCSCYKGIQIPSTLPAQPISVRSQVEMMSEDQAIISLQFVSGERIHYQMTANLGPQQDFDELQKRTPTENPKTDPFIYDGDVLFHGPHYQVLQEVYTLNDDGARAGLKVPKSSSRAMMIDGGIQLALLWLWKHQGRGSLPSSIKRLYFGNSEIPGNLVAEVRGTIKDNFRGDADIVFCSPNGETLASIEGLQLTSYFAKPFPEPTAPSVPLYH